nr:PREDICTED: interleukin-3 receptor class 2 subunit beta-like [Latimeria chalumnae]|eukprot:XP_014352932.1 PREDICTED: interleukin-3 receptor class 2 subunit beta-like [Latimeria chalumnae]
MEAGDFLLSWKTRYNDNRTDILPGKLVYEVSYRREWEAWQNSASVETGPNPHFRFKRSHLTAGCKYSARVRAKHRNGSGYRGYWSEWSSETEWETQSGDEALPQNLQCVYNGFRVECSWEVRREIAESIPFQLEYQQNSRSQAVECPPGADSRDVELTSPYRVYRCGFETDSQNSVSVTVKPAESPKEISLNQNKTTQQDHYIFDRGALDLSTKYFARVRAKHNGYYFGPWSEWTKEVTWTTSGSSNILLLVIVPFLLIFLLAMLVLCIHTINR